MKKRNVALCIIFSIITLGIYGLYWFVHITNDVNTLANPEKKTSGGVSLLLAIITFNLYGIYWAYKMGGLLDKAQTDRGHPAQNRAVLYLILELIIAPVAWILMHRTITSTIEQLQKQPKQSYGCEI